MIMFDETRIAATVREISNKAYSVGYLDAVKDQTDSLSVRSVEFNYPETLVHWDDGRHTSVRLSNFFDSDTSEWRKDSLRLAIATRAVPNIEEVIDSFVSE